MPVRNGLSKFYVLRFSPISVNMQSWHASDGSAYALLSPWHRVFGDQLWDGLLMRSILPKLAFALQVRLTLIKARICFLYVSELITQNSYFITLFYGP